ncbi:hypothetical protein [Lacinutrix sp. Hel_I_90]|uniref:hypothetical protein n=1 Tax=Lacinutrix sp. Hel_I_90 TaxID=1249999 RepID=UPI0005C886F8|nr:hypothetical protein [Lacinutrix sp. Hel_I_90]
MNKSRLIQLLILFCIAPFVLTNCSKDEDRTLQIAPTSKVFDGNVILNSQAQLDDFTAENYNIISGDLTIGFDASSSQMSDITNLSQFTALTGIGGKLNISNNPLLPNLEGLNNLNFVRGLELRVNNIITSILPLSNVLALQSLQVEDNEALKNLDGLIGVETIWEYAVIRRNNSMLNLNGLDNLTTIEDGILNITESPVLTNINALSSLEMIAGDLIINYTGLTSLNGLESLDVLEGDMFFQFNPELNNVCALENLVIQNGYSGEIFSIGNLYVASVQDIIDGNCTN